MWANELLDIPSMFMGRPSSPPDVVRGCLSSAGILVGAIITIGTTYLQQRRIVSGLLTICCYCHKVRLSHETWQCIEEYVTRHSLVVLSHGICPECYEKALADEVAGGQIGTREDADRPRTTS